MLGQRTYMFPCWLLSSSNFFPGGWASIIITINIIIAVITTTIF
jgi:hypothetical protein